MSGNVLDMSATQDSAIYMFIVIFVCKGYKNSKNRIVTTGSHLILGEHCRNERGNETRRDSDAVADAGYRAREARCDVQSVDEGS